MLKKLKAGIDSFEKIRELNLYYVDKTMLIEELLNDWDEVNLFTRPRRFGKSLTMSMLKSFFEVGCDKSLFDELQIMQDKELCEEHMGKYPVIFISLKSVNGDDFETAYTALRRLIGKEAKRFKFLLDSDVLDEDDKEIYTSLTRTENGVFTMQKELLIDSLSTLSQLLSKHYGRKTILLIDEYDVPLDKAFENGYYDEMVILIRNLLGNALKTNPYLQFAVLSGCLRISKESIFTGLNNLRVNSITDYKYDEYFGFTDSEVDELLSYYGLGAYREDTKKWYDGYRFGNREIYCPWDVINYCCDLLDKPDISPKNYWANTSSNYLVRRFIDMANQQTRDEIEKLIAGETITKRINQELTYCELNTTIDNIWSLLFTTGYLTARSAAEDGRLELAIPNMEINSLFVSQVRDWFSDRVASVPEKLSELFDSVITGDAAVLQKSLTDYLKQTISIRDTASRKETKENFYHGLLLGLLSHHADWSVSSNREAGDGYSDILIRDSKTDTGVVIEVKYADNANFDTACEEAKKQVEEKQYDEAFYDDGMVSIIKYGIAFYKKRCVVKKFE